METVYKNYHLGLVAYTNVIDWHHGDLIKGVLIEPFRPPPEILALSPRGQWSWWILQELQRQRATRSPTLKLLAQNMQHQIIWLQDTVNTR